MLNLCVALLVLAAIGGASLQKPNDIQALSWMKGSWKCEIWGGTFEEHWSDASGGTMIGMGRLNVSGKTRFMEFMSIESTGDGLTMFMVLDAPSKGDKKPVPFRLTSLSKDEAVFENPKNDFPTRIVYRRKDANGMHCRIEGKQQGKDAQEDFNFTRVTD
jgi:hypothetical protein